MLSGVKLVDRTEAERRHKEERKKEKKERKKHKKVLEPVGQPGLRGAACRCRCRPAATSACLLSPLDLCPLQEKRSKHKRRDDSSDGGGGGSSSDGGGAIGRRGRRREQWEDPSDSGSDSEGGGGPSGAGAGGSGAQREDWMTKPMARQKTDEQLAAEEEERAAKEAEARRRDPDQPFVSVRAVAAGPGCAVVEQSRRCVVDSPAAAPACTEMGEAPARQVDPAPPWQEPCANSTAHPHALLPATPRPLSEAGAQPLPA